MRKNTSVERKKRQLRKMGIRAKILLPASILIVLLCAVLGISAYVRLRDGLVAMGVEQARMAAVVSVKVVDGEQLEILIEKGQCRNPQKGRRTFRGPVSRDARRISWASLYAGLY